MKRPSGRGATSDAEMSMLKTTAPIRKILREYGIMSDFERRLMAETAKERASGATSMGERKIRARRVRPRPKRR